MKKICKRIISLLMVFTMVFSGMTMPVMAEEETQTSVVASGSCGKVGDGTNLLWSLTGEEAAGYTLTITGEGAIKDYVQGTVVLWTEYAANITEVILPEGLTEIGNSNFSNCSRLEKITLPSALTKIGASAFENCTSLTEIVIPDSVITISNNAFKGCISLRKVEFELPAAAGFTISGGAFQNCTSLTEFAIPDGVTTINASTFSGCTSLTTITIPNTVTMIWANAFADCTNLKTVNFIGTITEWNKITPFDGNDALKTATVRTKPVITTQPAGASYKVNAEDVTPLKVEAAGDEGAVLSYQWYVNSTNSNENGTAIEGATSAEYTPNVSKEGTSFYYCVVTSTIDGYIAETASNTAQIFVDESGVAIVASGDCGDGVVWKLTEDGVLTISGEGAMV